MIATSLAGVRGAVTLAGVLTLPLALPGGAAFPGRDLAIFLASGVLLISLLVASLGLSGPAARLTPEVLASLGEAVRQAAAEATIALGGTVPDRPGD